MESGPVSQLGSAARPAELVDAPPLRPEPASVSALLDDTSLMLRYRDGDVRAFELLYERHKRPLYRYLQRMCRNSHVADDLFQEVWSKVIATRARYEVRAQFNTFLFRVAHNCLVDHFRRAGRKAQTFEEGIEEAQEHAAGAEHEEPDRAAAEAQLRAAFRRALDALPGEQRDVFVLYEESGLSLEEIGQVTGVAMETAKSRLRYALAKLRAALSEHHPQRLSTQP
ncbi:MAG TPA: RNA polymerase sigma factor [Steroidobacteraceae bacterium]